MVDPQDWWPKIMVNYVHFMNPNGFGIQCRYLRIWRGRGGAGAGMQRFAPLNSCLIDAIWIKPGLFTLPCQQKYGRKISWPILMMLAEMCPWTHGFENFGFGGERMFGPTRRCILGIWERVDGNKGSATLWAWLEIHWSFLPWDWSMWIQKTKKRP